MQKILIIGGTNFIGRNLIYALLKLEQYDLTLFNRGVTNPNTFPTIKRLKGDRNTNDVERIGKYQWNYIIDLSCYFPNSLEQILKTIKGAVKRYIFVSTCSVYDNTNNKTLLRGEKAEIHSCTLEQCTNETPSTYSNRKAACERLLQASNLDYIVIRPPIVYGAYDHTDRFYYWLHQVKNYNPILLPDNGERTFSCVYVQDLVNIIIQSLTIEKHQNTYNITTVSRISIKKIVETAASILNKNPTFVNALPTFLHQQKIGQWKDMPLWLDCDYFTYTCKKLIKDFDFQPTNFEESIKETILYYEKQGWKTPIYGISEEKQQALLKQL